MGNKTKKLLKILNASNYKAIYSVAYSSGDTYITELIQREFDYMPLDNSRIYPTTITRVAISPKSPKSSKSSRMSLIGKLLCRLLCLFKTDHIVKGKVYPQDEVPYDTEVFEIPTPPVRRKNYINEFDDETNS